MKLTIKTLRKIIAETVESTAQLAKQEYEEYKELSKAARFGGIFSQISPEEMQEFKDSSSNIQEFLKKVISAIGPRKINAFESIQLFYHSEFSVDEILDATKRFQELKKNFHQAQIHSEENSMYGRGQMGVYHTLTGTLVDTFDWRKGGLGT